MIFVDKAWKLRYFIRLFISFTFLNFLVHRLLMIIREILRTIFPRTTIILPLFTTISLPLVTLSLLILLFKSITTWISSYTKVYLSLEIALFLTPKCHPFLLHIFEWLFTSIFFLLFNCFLPLVYFN